MAAKVTSIEAVREFRLHLLDYGASLRQALDMLTAELTRAVEYFESDRAAYWPAQVRIASDQLATARIDLQRRQVSADAGEGPSFIDEKKALARAKARLHLAQEKVKATRRWLRLVHKEVDEFQTRVAQLRFLLDAELPRGVGLLARLASRLDRYVGQHLPDKTLRTTSPAGEGD